MAIKVSNTSDIDMHHVFMLIVGASGVGKTTLAGTLDPEHTVIISAESGLLSLRNKSIEVWNVENKSDLIDAFNEIIGGRLLSNGNQIKNVVMDSITEIGEIIFTELKPQFSKAQKFGLYEEYGTKLIGLIKALRDEKRYNFFMTALDKDMGEGVIGIDLIQKSLSKKLPQYFDIVAHYCTMEHEGETLRKLITDNTISDFCKDRSGSLDSHEEPDLTTILNKVFKTGEKE